MKLLLIFTSLVVFVDQISKYLIMHFNYEYHLNMGISWGIGSGISKWYWIVAIIGLVVYLFVRVIRSSGIWIEKLIWGLIIGGGIGNLVDRVRLGGVIDWIMVVDWFPWFNLADVFICVGVGIMIVRYLYDWILKMKLS